MGLGTDNGFDLFYGNGEGGDALASSYTGLSEAPVDFAIDSVPNVKPAFAAYDNYLIFSDVDFGGGVFGQTWYWYPQTPGLRGSETITSLAVLNATGLDGGDTVVYVGTNRAVYRSTYNNAVPLYETTPLYLKPISFSTLVHAVKVFIVVIMLKPKHAVLSLTIMLPMMR